MKFHENWLPRNEELVAPLLYIIQFFAKVFRRRLYHLPMK